MIHPNIWFDNCVGQFQVLPDKKNGFAPIEQENCLYSGVLAKLGPEGVSDVAWKRSAV